MCRVRLSWRARKRAFGGADDKSPQAAASSVGYRLAVAPSALFPPFPSARLTARTPQVFFSAFLRAGSVGHTSSGGGGCRFRRNPCRRKPSAACSCGASTHSRVVRSALRHAHGYGLTPGRADRRRDFVHTNGQEMAHVWYAARGRSVSVPNPH